MQRLLIQIAIAFDSLFFTHPGYHPGRPCSKRNKLDLPGPSKVIDTANATHPSATLKSGGKPAAPSKMLHDLSIIVESNDDDDDELPADEDDGLDSTEVPVLEEHDVVR